MGKKKHKRERHEASERERAEAAAAGAQGPRPFDPAPLAGLAPMAMERVNTPEFRSMMTGALGLAAQTFDRRRDPRAESAHQPPVPPVAPFAPVPPVPPTSAERPAAASSDPALPPELAAAIDRVAAHAGEALESAAAIAAHAIGTAAAAVERWADQQRDAFTTPRKPEEPPRG